MERNHFDDICTKSESGVISWWSIMVNTVWLIAVQATICL